GINPGEPQVLKIFKPDTNEYYYIGYRRPIGYDSNLVTQYRDRTNVHRWNGVGGTFTYFLSALSDGQSYTDLTNGITITQTSHDTSRSYVSVSFSGPECLKANPTVVTVSPISQSGTPGSTKNYTVTVNNNNSSVCPSNQYNLSNLIPSGWSASFSPSVLNLNSGQQGSSTWSVASSSGAVAGSYQITAQAVDAVDSTYTDSENATYVVFIYTTPPTVSITNPINGTTVSGTVNIQVNATDTGSINRVEIYIDGSLKKTDTSTPYDYSWNTRKYANGTHTITARGYDQQGNFSQPSITVTKVKR
ncbi:MAG TPA: Ig-like domain-containing protein, partial [Thermodesulfobacteriota bacterium]|nr:Ig-like domain-containing protein [Thermodesulfobacteriota bacterium]